MGLGLPHHGIDRGRRRASHIDQVERPEKAVDWRILPVVTGMIFLFF